MLGLLHSGEGGTYEVQHALHEHIRKAAKSIVSTCRGESQSFITWGCRRCPQRPPRSPNTAQRLTIRSIRPPKRLPARTHPSSILALWRARAAGRAAVGAAVSDAGRSARRGPTVCRSARRCRFVKSACGGEKKRDALVQPDGDDAELCIYGCACCARHGGRLRWGSYGCERAAVERRCAATGRGGAVVQRRGEAVDLACRVIVVRGAIVCRQSCRARGRRRLQVLSKGCQKLSMVEKRERTDRTEFRLEEGSRRWCSRTRTKYAHPSLVIHTSASSARECTIDSISTSENAGVNERSCDRCGRTHRR